MRRYLLTPDGLRLDEVPDPGPGPGELLVRVRACSLNYRDIMILRGEYGRPGVTPLVPLSDCAGEVAALGDGVDTFAVGDRVAGCLFQNWASGPIHADVYGSDLGFSQQGVLSELRVFGAGGLVKLPRMMSFAEGATLPVAGVTAFNAVMPHVARGRAVLLLGTGGVSLFALLLAKHAGARVIITSSDDEKLRRARELGADEGINYRTHEAWDEEVLRLTAGRGVDLVVETGGAATFNRSVIALAPGGRIAQVGRLTGVSESVNIQPLVYKAASLHGVFCGSRDDLLALVELADGLRLAALLDDLVPFDEAPRAFERLQSGRHFGKVVVMVNPPETPA